LPAKCKQDASPLTPSTRRLCRRSSTSPICLTPTCSYAPQANGVPATSLLWQTAYTELYITPVLWPDFTMEHLIEAILDYQQRQRKFGGVLEPVGSG
jgi:hypothetical protein